MDLRYKSTLFYLIKIIIHQISFGYHSIYNDFKKWENTMINRINQN